jgi:hypothetical protein
MKSMLRFLLLVACASAAARAQDGTAAYKAARAKALKAKAAADEGRSFAPVNAKADWKGWLTKTFPDASKSWTADCAKSAGPAAGIEEWDFLGKGDIDRDDAPTLLMIRIRASPKKKRRIVTGLSVKKCVYGRWDTLLNLSGDHDVRFDSGDPKDAVSPGLTISAALVDAEGKVISEDEDYFFLPKLQRYGGDADREAVAAGKEIRKAKPR